VTGTLSSNDPDCFHVLATSVCGPVNLKSAGQSRLAFDHIAELREAICGTAVHAIGNCHGEWPPEEDML
jgi:hypothetical protein